MEHLIIEYVYNGVCRYQCALPVRGLACWEKHWGSYNVECDKR